MNLLFLFLALSADQSLSCNYAGGFKKGLQDFEGGSYGANPDKYCYATKLEDREAFLRAYDEGRDHAYLFQKVKMTTIPESHADFQALLKEARSLQVQVEKPATEAKAIEDRLKSLEAENKNLKEEINTLRGISLNNPSTDITAAPPSENPAIGDDSPKP